MFVSKRSPLLLGLVGAQGDYPTPTSPYPTTGAEYFWDTNLGNWNLVPQSVEAPSSAVQEFVGGIRAYGAYIGLGVLAWLVLK